MGSTPNRRRVSQFKFAAHKYALGVNMVCRTLLVVRLSDASPLAINLLIIFSVVCCQDLWGRRIAEGYKIHTLIHNVSTFSHYRSVIYVGPNELLPPQDQTFRPEGNFFLFAFFFLPQFWLYCPHNVQTVF